jgi:uncharacterized protein (TIGR02145 family)
MTTYKLKKCLLFAAVTSVIFFSCDKDDPPAPVPPTVTTTAISDIKINSAKAGGTIVNNGGSEITTSGICWSKTNATPTTSDSVVTSNVLTGSFVATLDNLEDGSTYYIRAFATNSIGTGYGNVVTFNTTIDTTKVKFEYNGEEVSYGIIISPVTGRKWMDRNLGATKVADSIADAPAYGDLFQWGRLADGHQIRTSDTTSTLSTSDVPGNNNFIFGNTAGSNPTLDWREPSNINLWQGSTGVNNPCPTGWHVPTSAEWQAETGITNLTTAFNVLKIPGSGIRYSQDGSLNVVGSDGSCWTSTFDDNPAIPSNSLYYEIYNGPFFGISSNQRSMGIAVRCIKD